MKTPKETGVLFNGDMVRAILRGDKTATRRLVKPIPPSHYDWRGWVMSPFDKKNDGAASWGHRSSASYAKPLLGNVGDKIYVRETTIIAPKYFSGANDGIKDSDGDYRVVQYLASHPCRDAANDYKLKATPSIHMPKWAARTWLEITGVKVQRLQDISTSDAINEGIPQTWGGWMGKAPQWAIDSIGEDFGAPGSHLWDNRTSIENFRLLWISIYGQESWDANPWVFSYSFKIITN